jgi:Helicase associated domain
MAATLRRKRGSIALLLQVLLSRNTDTNAFESLCTLGRRGLIGSGQKRGRPPFLSITPTATTTTRAVDLLLWLPPPNSPCPRRRRQHYGFFSRDPSCRYHQSRQEDFDPLQVTASIYDSSLSSTDTARLVGVPPSTARTEESAVSDSSSSRLAIVGQPKPARIRRESRSRLKWDNMIIRLEKFRKTYGHSLVTSDCEDQDLYRWAVTIRRNYRHQVLPTNSRKRDHRRRRHHHLQMQPSDASSSTVQFSSDKKSKTIITTTSRRPRLSTEKLLQLAALDFCWDVQAAVWDRHYEELRAFSHEHGHVNIPPSHPGGLALWVQNQRREYRRLAKLGPESSTLVLDNRLKRLESLNFEWCQAHEDAWLFQYEQLKKFHATYGHSNVPEDYKDNFSLGQWCMNQRSAYKRYHAAIAGHNNNSTSSTTKMSPDRIQKLQRLDFCWAYREQKWNEMKQRLVDYYAEHGNILIPTTDTENQDLRMWLIMQRYYYNRRRGGQRLYRASVKRDAIAENSNEDDSYREPTTGSSIGEGLPSSLTENRIKELENAIPGFRWTAYETGPSRKDWAKLFNAMREKGIQPGMRPKQHWFEGTNPFSIAVKDRWTEQDLLELWNQDGGDDDDDDDDDMSWRAAV